MTNEELIQKMKEDKEMRGFSRHTYDSYLNKTRDVMHIGDVHIGDAKDVR